MQDCEVGARNVTDAQLVESVRQGDKDAFGTLIQRHQAKCAAVAWFYLRNHGEAEEQAQNAIEKAYEHFDQYQGDAEFSTWLFRIVANECLMLMRERRRAPMLYIDETSAESRTWPVELPASGPDPEGELAARQMIDVLKREIRLIPPLLRNVIILRDVKELPMNDVAEQLGITISAAKSRLLRARSELRLRVMRHYSQADGSSPLSRVAAPLQKLGRHRIRRPAIPELAA